MANSRCKLIFFELIFFLKSFTKRLKNLNQVHPISSFDAAGSFLLLGGQNGILYYIDMQKFPLRMKDNDLLVTELYKDPSGDAITALSVYLTPYVSI